MSYHDREWYREDIRRNKRKIAFKRILLKILKWFIICYLAASLICAYRVQKAFSIAGSPFYSLSVENVVNSWIIGYVPEPMHMMRDLFSTDDELIEAANRTLNDMFIP